MHELVLPQLGEGIEKATVAVWHVRSGDIIKSQDDVVEVVTDKATFYVPAGAEGRLQEICAPAGAEVAVGQVLARISPLEKA